LGVVVGIILLFRDKRREIRDEGIVLVGALTKFLLKPMLEGFFEILEDAA
jgi:hypothetical protein